MPNTERFNATFRDRLACLVRRGQALARTVQTLAAGIYLLGYVYNFCATKRETTQNLRCRFHNSSRRILSDG